MQYLAVTIAAFVLGALVPPSLALGRQPAPEPKLTATPGSSFPDRTYMLQLPPRLNAPKLVLTENGGPVLSLAIAPLAGSASDTYLISYRSVLPPQVEARVSATITGLPAAAATATYATPSLDDMADGSSDRRWQDSPYVTVVVSAALLALLAFALLTRLEHRV